MTPKTTKIAYWILAIIFSLFMLMDGVGGLMQEKTGVGNMQHLNYPVYMMTIMGFAKVIGALVLLQTRYKTIREWAYSGFTISFIGAAWSRIYIGDPLSLWLPPVVMLIVMFVYYFLWKKMVALETVLNANQQ